MIRLRQPVRYRGPLAPAHLHPPADPVERAARCRVTRPGSADRPRPGELRLGLAHGRGLSRLPGSSCVDVRPPIPIFSSSSARRGRGRAVLRRHPRPSKTASKHPLPATRRPCSGWTDLTACRHEEPSGAVRLAPWGGAAGRRAALEVVNLIVALVRIHAGAEAARRSESRRRRSRLAYSECARRRTPATRQCHLAGEQQPADSA